MNFCIINIIQKFIALPLKANAARLFQDFAINGFIPPFFNAGFAALVAAAFLGATFAAVFLKPFK